MSIGRVPGATGIQPSIVTAKGDLIVATASGSVTNQAVGTNNQVLMADSAQADGVKWANEATSTLTTTGDMLYASAANTLARRAIGSTGDVLTVSGGVPTWAAPAGGGSNWSLLGSASLTGAQTVTISGISGKNKIAVYILGASASASATFSVRFNSDTGNNYATFFGSAVATATAANMVDGSGSVGTDQFRICRQNNVGTSVACGVLYLDGGNTSGVKTVFYMGSGAAGGSGTGQEGYYGGGYYSSASTISSVSVYSTSGNLDAGTMYVYTSTN